MMRTSVLATGVSTCIGKAGLKNNPETVKKSLQNSEILLQNNKMRLQNSSLLRFRHSARYILYSASQIQLQGLIKKTADQIEDYSYF